MLKERYGIGIGKPRTLQELAKRYMISYLQIKERLDYMMQRLKDIVKQVR